MSLLSKAQQKLLFVSVVTPCCISEIWTMADTQSEHRDRIYPHGILYNFELVDKLPEYTTSIYIYIFCNSPPPKKKKKTPTKNPKPKQTHNQTTPNKLRRQIRAFM